MSLFSFGTVPVKRAIAYESSLWVGVVFWVLLTGGAFWFGAYWTWENHLFADHVRDIAGVVESKYTTVSHDRHGSHTSYHLGYAFTVGGFVYHSRTTVHFGTWAQVREGAAIPIKYLPERPKDNRIDNTAEEFDKILDARIGLGVGVVSLVVGGLLVRRTYRRNQLQRRLVATGLSTTGRVTSVDSERVGKQTKLFLRFEFNDNRGQTVEARSWPLSSVQEQVWSAGKGIGVYYDPGDSGVFTIDLDAPR